MTMNDLFSLQEQNADVLVSLCVSRKPRQCELYSLGPLTTTFSSPLPAFLVSTLKSPTCFTLIPDGWRPRPVALHAPGIQAGQTHMKQWLCDVWWCHDYHVYKSWTGVLTRSHVHTEGALGDHHPSEGDGNCVWAGLNGPVGAAIHAVAFILHHHLHGVLAALRVSDHGRHISGTGSYREDDKKRKL